MTTKNLIWVEYDNGESYSDHSHNLVGIFKTREKADEVAKAYLQAVGAGGSCSYQLIPVESALDEHNTVYLGYLTAAWAPIDYNLPWEEREASKRILHYNWVDSELYDWKNDRPFEAQEQYHSTIDGIKKLEYYLFLI